MYMRFFSLLFFLLFVCIKAQVPTVSGDFTLNADPYKAEVLDESIQNIYYKLLFVKNPKQSEKKLEVLCVLQIGKNHSKFSDFNTLRKDSLIEEFSRKGKIGAKEFNKILALRVNWKNVLIKNTLEKHNIYQENITQTYQYEEAPPALDWQLGSESKEILGYHCKNAMVQYRGRKYTAWYAPDIPINNGPYVFQGLPGLIMEIGDDKGDYHFSATAMDQKKNDIYLRNEDQILHTERKKFRKAYKSFTQNPGFFLGPVYDGNGDSVTPKTRSKPYNPIELE